VTIRPLRLLFVTPEAVPFAKTGGLADVTGALPRALARLGHEVRIILPRYRVIDGPTYGFREVFRLAVPHVGGAVSAVIERGWLAGAGSDTRGDIPVYAVRYDPYFDREGLYQEEGKDYPDNLARYAFFSRAVLEVVAALGRTESWVPQVLHGHDWQAALSLIYVKTIEARRSEFRGLRSLFTIHNVGYQGLFPGDQFATTGLGREWFTPAALEFYGQVNLMKGAILFADYLTTVSPTYSREIQTDAFGFGLEGVLAQRRDRLVGIVNGIDTELWNPQTDPEIPARYTVQDLAGKQVCKEAVQRELHLPVGASPLCVVISRLASQKGLDLVAEIVPELVRLNAQFILLGTGDAELEQRFQGLAAQYPKHVAVRFGFDEGLAHRIEAGGDLFLMPSRYEPCGLSQLISLRYGTVPVVRRTGGLADTVSPCVRLEGVVSGTGFVFREATEAALLGAVREALEVYADRGAWARLVNAAMNTDVSWEKSAAEYVALYQRMLSG
jgi:starch synthase